MRSRLDQILVKRGLIETRSKAEDFIKRGFVIVNGQIATKPAMMVDDTFKIKLKKHVSFVSRAGEKLYSVIDAFRLNFKDKIVLDVGSSTGGFTEVALKNGAKKVIAVDVGTDQLHPSLRIDPRVELHEKTDIRDAWLNQPATEGEQNAKSIKKTSTNAVFIQAPDIIVIDVSFVSLRQILPHIAELCSRSTQIIAMCKPQFEAGEKQKNKGVVKNDTIRRQILKDFEIWLKSNNFITQNKRDSGLSGAKGNLERFYLLQKSK